MGIWGHPVQGERGKAGRDPHSREGRGTPGDKQRPPAPGAEGATLSHPQPRSPRAQPSPQPGPARPGPHRVRPLGAARCRRRGLRRGDGHGDHGPGHGGTGPERGPERGRGRAGTAPSAHGGVTAPAARGDPAGPERHGEGAAEAPQGAGPGIRGKERGKSARAACSLFERVSVLIKRTREAGRGKERSRVREGR